MRLKYPLLIKNTLGHTVCQLATVGIAYASSVIVVIVSAIQCCTALQRNVSAERSGCCDERKQEGIIMYEQIYNAVESVDNVVWGWGMIILLLGTHLFLTIRNRDLSSVRR